MGSGLARNTMNKEPILFAINDLGAGGGQHTVVEEANELIKRGKEVYVVMTLADPSVYFARSLDIPMGNLIHIPFDSLFDIGAYEKLAKFLKENEINTVISNLFFTNTIMRLCKIWYPQLQVIIREGNVIDEKGWGGRIVDLFLSPLVRTLIANSKNVARSIKILYPFSKLHIIYNGIEEEFFKPISQEERQKIRTELGVKPGEQMIVTVGSLTEKKGHQYLIDAAGEMRGDSSLPPWKIYIAGEGHLRYKGLEARAKEVGQGKVVLLGMRDDVGKLLKACDIFVLPSLWEGMPNVMLQAFAAGCPVVATDVGGVGEFLHDEETGLLVPKADRGALAEALKRLLKDKTLTQTLSRNAKESVSHLTWKEHINQLLSVL
jgi:glycosyltransferase involved in cell wall biosynthesis